MPYEGMSPAAVYGQEVVTGIFGESTPALVTLARPQTDERVLDLARGSGAVLREVTPWIGPSGSLMGVDVSGPMLEVARARGVPDGVPIERHEAFAEQLPLAGADVVATARKKS